MLQLLTPELTTYQSQSGLVIEPRSPMPSPVRSVGDWLVHWAKERPDSTFLAQRDANGLWEKVSYEEALSSVEGIATALLAYGATPTRPVMLLSENSIQSALLLLGAMQIGVPVAPISSAYSLLSTSFERLREVASQVEPGFLFADDPTRYSAALEALSFHKAIHLSAKPGENGITELAQTKKNKAMQEAFDKIRPDTIAKILFTSGSTGSPKGVINTQRMLTSNQESLAACWPFLAQRPPVVVDWLPWSHTFGGNHNFFLVLRNGGSLFIDRGRPVPGLIDVTIQNLAEVSPTLWFNVPRGFDQAAALLEKDPLSAEKVCQNLDLIFYAAAALSPSTRARLERIAEAAGRPDIFFTSAWGSTETSPLATSAHFATRTTGILGVPVPGVCLKLAPMQDQLELRVRGPNVTPGYWRAGGAITPIQLDEDGFLSTGDAGRLVDDARPELGVVFIGRLSENFKLSSGTWVNVAQTRLALVEACAPLLLDVVIAGHDRDSLGALLFLSPAAKLLAPADCRQRLRAGIDDYNKKHPGGSERIQRALLLHEPLSLDQGETTDKGYTNQRRVLTRRSAEVERLFGEEVAEDLYLFG